MGRLSGKTAFITGGASGLGEGMAKLFVAEGARVALGDIDEEQGARVKREIGDAATFLKHDVTNEDDWRTNIEAAAERLGKINIVVNSAGISVPASIVDATFDHWRQVMAINLDGVFLGCHYGLKKILENGEPGSIVNISSTLGSRTGPLFTAYGASKAGVLNLTQSVALHCAETQTGVRCNAIQPGAIRTPMMEAYLKAAPDYEEALAGFKANHPMNEVGEPNDIAYAAVFLASDESKFVTGVTIPVDGGYCAA